MVYKTTKCEYDEYMSIKSRNIRIPQQKRSIEKKTRIIEAAYEVFSSKGYNNSTTPDIAKAAGISTGTLYAYFCDKKELFLECSKKYTDKLQARILQTYNNLPALSSLEIIEITITSIIDMNNIDQGFQKELMSLIYLDKEIRKS